jgi:hypothetical protein
VKKQLQYIAKVAKIDPLKLDKLNILFGTVKIGEVEHVMMAERDWKWAVKAGAATIQK